MKTKLIILLAILIVAAVNGRAATVGTEFTYQGRLTDATGAPSGSYDFAFTLHLAASGGVPIVTVTNLNRPVSNGLFTATVDFGGGIYNGNAYWISLGVRSNGTGGSFTALTPRQPLTPTPNASYASLAGTVPGGSITSSKLAVDSVTVFALQSNAVTAAKVAAGQLVKSVNGLRDDVVLSAGPNVTITPSGNTLTLGGSSDWKLGGNAGTTPGTQFLGTTDDQALVVKVNNTVGFRVEPATSGGSILPNVIGGAFNSIASGQAGSTISGGRENVVSSTHAAIGGGWRNQIHAGSEDSAIAGGQANVIQANANFSTIGAGAIHNIGVGASRSTIGGGYFNRIGDGSTNTTISGGRDNVVRSNTTSSTIGGGLSNTIKTGNFGTIASTIGGGEGNVIEINDARYATISGGYQNTNSEVGATVGGGYRNTSSGAEATVAGGYQNIAGPGSQATVGGGFNNTATGPAATVGGGANNISSGANATVSGGGLNKSLADSATVGGGANHISSGVYATIGGGNLNLASGVGATVPGGSGNTAGGRYSFAAGQGAKANHDGSFVWTDSQFVIGGFPSTANDEFSIRATGGVRIDSGLGIKLNAADSPMITRGWDPFTSGANQGLGRWGLFMENSALVAGIPAAGGRNFKVAKYNPDGTFSSLLTVDQDGNLFTAGAINPPSDRNLKENFAPVSPREVLEKVAALPISRWNFKGDAATPHVGPMAQDFHAAFGLGTDNKHIATVDADGVALAAIQGLNQKLEQKLEQKQTEITELKQRLEKLEHLFQAKNGGTK